MGKGKIPVMPGAALGVVVKPQALAAMEAEAKAIQQREQLEQQVSDLEAEMREHITKKASYLEAIRYNHKTGKNGEYLWCLFYLHWTLADNCAWKLYRIGRQLARESWMGRTMPIDAGMSQPTFSRALKSPIAATSKFEVQRRGFASFSVNSTYVDMQEDAQSTSDRSTSSTQTVSAGGYGVRAEFSRSVASRVHSAKSSGKVEQTLVINAHADLKNVLCYTDIQFDIDALRSLISAMNVVEDQAGMSGSLNVRPEFADNNGIAVEIDPMTGAPMAYIFVLTEAVLGASFAGIVNFLKTNESNSKATKNTSEYKASVSGKFWGISFGASAARNQSGETAESANKSNLNVTFEFVSQGAHPGFKRNDHTTDVMTAGKLSASDAGNSLSQKEADGIDKIITNPSFPKNTSEMQAFEVKRNLQKENANAQALASMGALTATTKTTSVLDPDSLNEAFENFVRMCKEDPEVGVPIGWNYTKFTREMLEEKLDAMESLLGKARRAIRNIVWETLSDLVPSPQKPFGDPVTHFMQRRKIQGMVWDSLRIHGVFDETGKINEAVFAQPGDLENNILTRNDLGYDVLAVGDPCFGDINMAKYRSELFRRRIASTLTQGHYATPLEKEYTEQLQTVIRIVTGIWQLERDAEEKAEKVVEIANEVKGFVERFANPETKSGEKKEIVAAAKGAMASISDFTGKKYSAADKGGLKVTQTDKDAPAKVIQSDQPPEDDDGEEVNLDELANFKKEQVKGYVERKAEDDPSFRPARELADKWGNEDTRNMSAKLRKAFEDCWEKNSVTLRNKPDALERFKQKLAKATLAEKRETMITDYNTSVDRYNNAKAELETVTEPLVEIEKGTQYATFIEERVKKLNLQEFESYS